MRGRQVELAETAWFAAVITAVPELLDQLALENSIVTLDAMGCQIAIAEKILARGGDYLLTLKGNHPLAHAAVVEHFDQRCFRVGAPSRADYDAFDDTHGRLVRRRVFASTDAAALDALGGWPGLRTVLAVESIRSVNSAHTKVESEIRYFLSSCPDESGRFGPGDPLALGCGECSLHWVLDVTFREDDSRVRDRTAARNLVLFAQDRAQHRRPRHDLKGQRARPAEKGRLERRLHAQAPGRVATELRAEPERHFMRSPCIAAAVMRWARCVFACPKYGVRRSRAERTPCAIVPSIPARRAYSTANSAVCSRARPMRNASCWASGRIVMARRAEVERVHCGRSGHARQSATDTKRPMP